MVDWLRIATEPRVVRRALKYALGVGAALIAINHGPAIMAGQLDGFRLGQMCLTVLVPYLVSTSSSVGAIRDFRRKPTHHDVAR